MLRVCTNWKLLAATKSWNKVSDPACVIINVQAGYHRMLAGPDTLFRDLIAAGNFHFVKALKEFHDGLQASVRNVATTENQALNSRGSMGKILNEVENVNGGSCQHSL